MATIKKRGSSYLIRCYDGYDQSGKQIERTMTWKIPEGMSQEEIDKLISEEDMERVDDYLVIATHQWKEDDGRFLYNTKIEGEIFGEEVSPWSEILVDDNGEITVADMIRMKKM